MNPFSEDSLVEQTVIQLIKNVWNDPTCHINAYKDVDDLYLERESRSDVVLKKFLRPALERLNPGLSSDALAQATDLLTRDRSYLSLVQANHEIYQLLKEGASVDVAQSDGSTTSERVRFFDFDQPEENHFLCVSQLWVVGPMHTRRPDVILFVNGIPLILMELKAAGKNLINAYQENIKDYKDTIPRLFWYNLGIIISNGKENKFGSLTSPYEFFNEWKKVEDESEAPNTDLRTMLWGVCDKTRLLDIFENFTLFDQSKGRTKKIVPRYFQYLGVNNAFKKVIDRDGNDGRLGVFWHTQGSGKSYSMVYLSQKVSRKVNGNYTFVIVTDRKELDRQAYENYVYVGAIYEKEVHATSIANLHQLLSEDHRQIFTTIQKFQDVSAAISYRDDIIVMTDEAHRTQYDRIAQSMRKALPNASFIGFTGTPLLAEGEEKTRETFGEYVSVYNFGDSVKDGATVPLYYENRVPKLENVNESLEKDLSKVMDFYDLNDEEEEKLEHEFSTFYQLVTREDRLNAVARDIVTHFVGRGYEGKAMVVSVDKKTAVRMYTKVKAEWDRYIAKLRMDISRASDERMRDKAIEQLERHENIDMAVVVSQSQNEISDLDEFEIDMRPLRQRMIRENLEEEFKNPDSDLRIVFVCAMWLTGFDVPNLSTLYLDKPLKNHTLMQTIARANRVAEGKKNGLIVDYIGVFNNIQRALALYAANGSGIGDIIRGKEDLIEDLRRLLVQIEKFLYAEQVDASMLLRVESEQRILLLDHYANKLISLSEKKKVFLNLATDLLATYRAVLPDPHAEDFYPVVMAITNIASRMRVIKSGDIDVSQVQRDLEDLLDRSIQAGEYVIPQHKRIKDLSKLDADALHDFFEDLDNKNLQVESMCGELEEKIIAMVERNKTRAQFMDRLNSILQEYNNGAHDIDQIFDDLVELARDLGKEEGRGARDNLSEEELAIFDLLQKEHLNPSECERVRSVARALIVKLKTEKLVIDWRDREATRAGVRMTVVDMLYSSLPEPVYTDADCLNKSLAVYNFVYEHYQDAKTSVFEKVLA